MFLSMPIVLEWQSHDNPLNQVYHPKPVPDDIIRSGAPYHGSAVLVATVKNYHRNNPTYSPIVPRKGKAPAVKEPRNRPPKENKEEPLIQKKYRKPEVDYSTNKPNAEEEAFRYFNKTPFAGLENLSANAYCNGALQLLYFIEPLRCALKSHICNKEFCLACELGFLFHMLDTQKGKTCQGSNFFRAFRTMRKAQMMELILKDDAVPKADLNRLIQTWIVFIMQQLNVDANGTDIPDPATLTLEEKPDTEKSDEKTSKEADDPEKEEDVSENEGNADKPDAPTPAQQFTSIVDDLFGMEIRIEFACKVCEQNKTRHDTTHVTDLIYPVDEEDIVRPTTFSHVLHNSLTCDQVIQTWCEKCGKYQAHSMRKFMKSFPDIFVLNCHLFGDSDLKFWSEQQKHVLRKFPKSTSEADLRELCRFGSRCNKPTCRYKHREASPAGRFEETIRRTWIPPAIETRSKSDGSFSVKDIYPTSREGELPKPISILPDEQVTQYECYAAIAHTGANHNTGGHLVALADVGYTYHQRKEGVTCTQCYLFNDFLISPIEKWEILEYEMEWKRPSILFFKRKNLNDFHKTTVENPLTTDLLFVNQSLVIPRRKLTFTPLGTDELPDKGHMVGVDAEFVSLVQEETELKRDGTVSTVKPSHMSLARVTVIRGDGSSRGVPFIDDYIVAQEQVVDYLTSFSGINPGDLNVKYSSKFLTPLKVTYSKLRVLVDRGVVFIGHGLKKDFKVINIIVPANQVVDTAELFRPHKRSRIASLKFLAWHFLQRDIQTASHDSIEDALAALDLYDIYNKLKESGELENSLKELFEKGNSLSWKVPDANSEQISGSPAK